MKLLFLDRTNLQYKDNAYVSSSYEVNLDMVVIQRSTFQVNKTNINCIIGDIVIFKNDVFSYIGILESTETKGNRTIVKTLDFREIFNIGVPVSSFTGDLADYLFQLIENNFKSNSDSNQNLPYLTVIKEASANGVLSYESDKIEQLSKIFELISKGYGINYLTDVTYLRGRITGIVFKIVNVNQGLVMKSNFSSILNVETNDSTSQLINKVVFYPRSDNQLHSSQVEYFLLKDGNITTNKNASERYLSVMLKSFIYSDNDYDTLETKARSEMVSSKLDHNITFSLDTNNKIFKLFDNLNLGDYISFIHSGKTYESIVTGIKFKNSLKHAVITLGEYRVKLTEKIQLLSKNKESSVSNVTITNTDLDGGEF
jgi:hypothetical protein